MSPHDIEAVRREIADLYTPSLFEGVAIRKNASDKAARKLRKQPLPRERTDHEAQQAPAAADAVGGSRVPATFS